VREVAEGVMTAVGRGVGDSESTRYLEFYQRVRKDSREYLLFPKFQSP
jgi:hypothetical protein